MSKTSESWWKEGVRFECQGSGQCCTSHGEYGFVFMTKEDRQRMARFLKMRTSDFTKKYCDISNHFYHLKEDPQNPDCQFLVNKRCSVYSARPTQCRTWPFWPEVMNAKTWKKEIASFCPGVGKGKVITAEVIEKNINEQKKSEDQSLKEAHLIKKNQFFKA